MTQVIASVALLFFGAHVYDSNNEIRGWKGKFLRFLLGLAPMTAGVAGLVAAAWSLA